MNKAFIFDFDGTLVDSEKTIHECFQRITKELAPDRIKYTKNILIGPPLRETASKILGFNYQDQLDKFVKHFIEMHDDQAIAHTKPYPKVNMLLEKLALMKIPMAIATNKRKAPTIKLIEHFRWANYFYSIQCSDSQSSVRNKNEMIQQIFDINNIFKNSYFLGDTVNDGLSANQNQLNFIKARYGYGKGQDWSSVKIYKSIGTFAELELI